MSYLCSKCGSELSEDALFCSKCGEKVTALRCPNCGKRLPEDSVFCTYCGAKIVAEQVVSPQPEVQQADHTAGVVPTVAIQQIQNRPIAEQSPATDVQEAPNPDPEPAKTTAPLSAEDATADIKPIEQQPTSAAAETIAAPVCDADTSSEQHHYHLTRRKFRLTNAWGFFSEFEETDLDVSDYTVTISDHLLNKNEPVLTQFQIPNLRQIFIGRTISIPWLCSALFFTILLLIYLVSDGTMGARASSLLLICVVMSWIMAWYRTITFYFKDGKKIIIRGREKAVMLELRQDLLGRIEAEPDYTGDLSDVVIKNTQYYLPEFEKAKHNEKCRFNWPAFFFNGIFAYYRKSQEIFWHYYKWPLIIYVVIILGISGSGFLAVQSDTGLLGWSIAVGALSLAINIYLLIVNICFGKSFNKEYYQHCMVRAESSEITPRTVGTSAKNAILYWIIMSLCVGVISVIAGGLISTALFSGLPDDLLENSSEYGIVNLTKSDIVGRWEFIYYEDNDVVISRESLLDAGYSEDIIEDYLTGNYLLFYENGLCEVHSYDLESSNSVYATWTLSDSTLSLLDADSTPLVSSAWIDGDILCMQADDQLGRYAKVSDIPSAPEKDTIDHTELNNNRSSWDYDDYVSYYGFDPADYGYEWYNEIRNGPLDEFFEMVYQELSNAGNNSRLYTITDPYSATLTPDDFVGRWVTNGGIVFTIEYYDGEYSIDFTENNNLSILGGWFSENTYNIEGAFSGMAGSTGVTSFSVSYEYGTDYPTHTWLTLDITESDGNEIIDYVSLT